MIKECSPIIILAVGFVGMLVAQYFDPGPQVIVAPWGLLAVVPIVVGVSINVAAMRLYDRHATPIRSFAYARTLLNTGLYARSRNPMYLGQLLVLVGIGVAMGSLAALVVIPITGWALYLLVIRPEERLLHDQFGATFDRYKKRTRCWL